MGGTTDGAGTTAGSSNVLSQLLALLLAEKAGLPFSVDEKALAELEKAVHAAARGGPEPASADGRAPGKEVERG